MKITVKFEHDVLGITKDNVNTKIGSYVTELAKKLIQNECENVKIVTNIRILTSKEVEMYLNIEDFK